VEGGLVIEGAAALEKPPRWVPLTGGYQGFGTEVIQPGKHSRLRLGQPLAP